MAKWTLKLHNPCYRAKPFDLLIECNDIQLIADFLAKLAPALDRLCEVLDRSER